MVRSINMSLLTERKPPCVRSPGVNEGYAEWAHREYRTCPAHRRASDTIAPMNRRALLSLFVFLIAAFITSSLVTNAQRTTQPAQRRTTTSTRAPRDEALWQRALAIHRRAIVVDTHNDITTPMTNDDFDLSGNPPYPYRTNIDRLKKGGVTGLFFSLYIKPWYVEHGGAARRTLDMIDSVYRAVERHPNELMIATTAADIRRAKSQSKIACLMGIEGGHAIEN